MANDADCNNNGRECRVRSALRCSLRRRHASLTEVERVFLHALLIDEPPATSSSSSSSCAEDGDDGEVLRNERIERATKVLDDDILFSLPFAAEGETRQNDGKQIAAVGEEESCRRKPPRPKRSNRAQLDLWKAHEDGVKPELLMMRSGSRASSSCIETSFRESIGPSSRCDSQIDNNFSQTQSRRKNISASLERQAADSHDGSDDDCERGNDDESANREDGEDGDGVNSLDVLSDREVGSINDDSSASSWNSSQGGFDHYDTWEVLRDEYAADFGFQVAVDDERRILPCHDDGDDDDDECRQRDMFKILGTSADDAAAAPHVLSPPLMDALSNFVPESLGYDNFWLKFSLVRDGASLDILKRYCRAATHTILAIETTNGEVFGAFVSSPWRTANRYFGTGEAFLWRMRHGRNTPVHCLFEQARLESEIDVFPYNGSNDYVQLCTSDKLALGGGSTALKKEGSIKEGEPLDLDAMPPVFLEDKVYGFGLALDENLLHGTTSPCATFGNNNLVNGSGSGETFDVMNLEVWGFTSAQTVREAQNSELSMFFVRESISSNLSSNTSTTSSSRFSGEELNRDQFYRRVGKEDDENASDRDAWQYANMMNPVPGSPYGKMRSPYGR